jgi:succinate dehydrogenase / fumarate reductase flavoprotein subunit
MEERYGKNGNLMPRDIVAKCIYDAPSQVYLDIAFLGEKIIKSRLFEIYELCNKYAGINVCKESIPVYPSVHFFMGGLFVDGNHKTTIDNLYAIGECSSRYHGANRLGGNSLLSAIYSGQVAANAIKELPEIESFLNFSDYVLAQEKMLEERLASKSRFSAVYIRQEIAKVMNDCLGITRFETKLLEGIKNIDYYLSISDKLAYDSDVSVYIGYSLRSMLILSRAILASALARKETRGAHIREDYPEKNNEYELSSVCEYLNGKHSVWFEKEGK